MRCQIFRPEPESSFGQPLLTEPESLTVIEEYFEGCSSPVAEQKEAAAHGICVQDSPAYPGKTVYSLSEVYRIDRYQDPHLGRNLDHAFQKSWASSITLKFPLILIRSPVGFSSSIVHSLHETAANSMKPGVEGTPLGLLARAFSSV